MLKQEGVVIIMIYNNKNKILNLKAPNFSFNPYNENVINFISDLSVSLQKNEIAKQHSDVMQFAFWCRRSNMIKKKENFKTNKINRLSLGNLFHIPPSNIPTNFAYSFIFGLITGNNNFVRVSNKTEPQSIIIIDEIKRLAKKKYLNIYKNNFFLKYEYDDEINEKFSKLADCRLIWGGNLTIEKFKKYKIKPYCKDINFFDRFSFSLINSEKIIKLPSGDLDNLAKKFYIDTYLTNQAACSSPILILWTKKNFLKANTLFWKSINKMLIEKKHNFTEFSVIDKDLFTSISFMKLGKYAKDYKSFDNRINVINLKSVPNNIDNFKALWGLFFQSKINNLKDVKKFSNRKYQTLTYFGFDPDEIIKLISLNNINGIDRVVPFGHSLDIDMIWDGLDLNAMLTRIISKY